MLPKHHRLRHRRDFSTVYQNGARRNSFALGLRAYSHRQNGTDLSSPSRIGISISQKVSKRAVVRNRIKRQLRAIVRQLLPHFASGWDVIIVVYPNALQCDYSEFLQQLKQLLTQAEILHGD
jgi:ribonuclease P protein component